MGFKVDNAIIMSAGLSSRFSPISHEKPKGLIVVRGEVLIERQIQQLQEAGIKEIILVVGYKKEQFYYLKEKFGVIIIENNEYETRNNHSSLYAARGYLKNTYICSSDYYYIVNPFEKKNEESFYSVVYQEGNTQEWCVRIDETNYITSIMIGGSDSLVMYGHAFFSNDFSKMFLELLVIMNNLVETRNKLWEYILMENIDKIIIKAKIYFENTLFEFDTLEELREFDAMYINHSGSYVFQFIAKYFSCEESEITKIYSTEKSDGFSFEYQREKYLYYYKDEKIVKTCII